MSGESGRRAPVSRAEQEMMDELAQLQGEVGGHRLRIMRQYLARSVCLASPLLLHACRPGELDEAAWKLTPGVGWPVRRGVQTLVRGPTRRNRFGPAGVEVTDKRSGERYHLMDQLRLRVSHRSAHMTLKIGAVLFRTSDDGGTLAMPKLMDYTERMDLEGQPLDTVLKHPIIDGMGYAITRVRSSVRQLRSVVDFVAPPEEWRVPWARPWDVPF